MEQASIHYLLEQYMTGTLRPEEREILRQALLEGEATPIIADIQQQIEAYAAQAKPVDQEEIALLLQRVVAIDRIPAATEGIATIPRRHYLRKWAWAAASIILLLGIGMYQWHTHTKTVTTATTVTTTEIMPGKEGATLTLADGSQVVLDSLGDGLVAAQNGSQVILQNGQIAYTTTGATTSEISYNTMSTPKGHQFQLTLPDGTRVWLNAASSVRYPTTFTGKERKVQVTGEAYFEVAQNAKMPFRVKANTAIIEVLGTEFNINAYANELSINTTLINGSIKVNETLLKPGQQMQLTSTISNTIKTVNIDKVLAWKNGMFNFEDASLEVVMRQLERWYDIDVVFEKGVPEIEFGGKMSRDIPLSGLLIALKKSKVNFRMEEGRRLIILP